MGEEPTQKEENNHIQSRDKKKKKKNIQEKIMAKDTTEKKDEQKTSGSSKAPIDKEDRKRKRQEKRQRKQDILDQIPKVNEDGISYTKQQIRRMTKRVERGLPPVPTAQEEAELKRQEAELRKEEELELAGMIYQKEQDSELADQDEEEGADDDEEEAEENEQVVEEEENDDKDEEKEEEAMDEFGRVVRKTTSKKAETEEEQRPKKKKKMSKKPVPDDYICQACHNKRSPPHWIYDCPDKVTVRGTNHVSASKKGNQSSSGGGNINSNAPSAKKVFVSGLFFDTKPNDVKAMFQSCGKVTSCKLLTFPDTGRCKGQAFVVFDTEESAKEALKLSGTKISPSDNNQQSSSNKKQKKGAAAKANDSKRELELRVSKVMSRVFTKATKQHS